MIIMKRSELKGVKEGLTDVTLIAQHVMVIPSKELNIRWDFVGVNPNKKREHRTIQFFVSMKDIVNNKKWIEQHSQGLIT